MMRFAAASLLLILAAGVTLSPEEEGKAKRKAARTARLQEEQKAKAKQSVRNAAANSAVNLLGTMWPPSGQAGARIAAGQSIAEQLNKYQDKKTAVDELSSEEKQEYYNQLKKLEERKNKEHDKAIREHIEKAELLSAEKSGVPLYQWEVGKQKTAKKHTQQMKKAREVTAEVKRNMTNFIDSLQQQANTLKERMNEAVDEVAKTGANHNVLMLRKVGSEAKVETDDLSTVSLLAPDIKEHVKDECGGVTGRPCHFMKKWGLTVEDKAIFLKKKEKTVLDKVGLKPVATWIQSAKRISEEVKEMVKSTDEEVTEALGEDNAGLLSMRKVTTDHAQAQKVTTSVISAMEKLAKTVAEKVDADVKNLVVQASQLAEELNPDDVFPDEVLPYLPVIAEAPETLQGGWDSDILSVQQLVQASVDGIERTNARVIDA